LLIESAEIFMDAVRVKSSQLDQHCF
jgi:hypothetical protein